MVLIFTKAAASWIRMSRRPVFVGSCVLVLLICPCFNTCFLHRILWQSPPVAVIKRMDSPPRKIAPTSKTTTTVRPPPLPRTTKTAASPYTRPNTRADDDYVLPTKPSQVKRIHLLGERNSGTNFLNEALVNAFRGYGRGRKSQHFQGEIPVLGYKHMVRRKQTKTRDLIAVRPVRQSVCNNVLTPLPPRI